MSPTIDTNRLNTWLPITVGEWLSVAPLVASQVPPEQHLAFLVRLLASLEIDFAEHGDCLIEAIVERVQTGEW